MSNHKKVLIIGAGLAGSDAAMYLANNGFGVVLVDSKTINKNEAQKLDTFAELVCTNSLKSKNTHSAHGLLKYEMECLNSLIIQVGKETAVPAGDALAVDRVLFSEKITQKLKEHPNIFIKYEEITDPVEATSRFNCDYTIIATGPLTTQKLSDWMMSNLSESDLYFYDAIAPVVDADSLDLSKMYYKDRYKQTDNKKDADYLNIPMNKDQYLSFIKKLLDAERVPPKNFEKIKYFESCLPIETMAERGIETPRFSCMKPVGLEMEDGTLPYAVIQLRRENLLGDSYNLVGFQTRLTYPEQLKVFRSIPGFQNAKFNHLGSIHRNTFLDARKLLNIDLSSKNNPNLFFAGQITGVEGYTESAAMGIYVAFQIVSREVSGKEKKFPKESAIGALVNYLMTVPKPTPSNINFGLLPSVSLSKEQRKNRKLRKKIKKELAVAKAQKVFQEQIMKERECSE